LRALALILESCSLKFWSSDSRFCPPAEGGSRDFFEALCLQNTTICIHRVVVYEIFGRAFSAHPKAGKAPQRLKKSKMGKRYFNLYEAIRRPLNLWAANKQAARGKRCQPAAAAFEFDLEKNLIELERELQDESCLPGGHHNFLIQRP
jgi:hypothetical protein